MSLAMLAHALAREPPREQAIIRMVAWLGRYGRQPASEVLRMPIKFALGMMEQIAEFIKDEMPEE